MTQLMTLPEVDEAHAFDRSRRRNRTFGFVTGVMFVSFGIAGFVGAVVQKVALPAAIGVPLFLVGIMFIIGLPPSPAPTAPVSDDGLVILASARSRRALKMVLRISGIFGLWLAAGALFSDASWSPNTPTTRGPIAAGIFLVSAALLISVVVLLDLTKPLGTIINRSGILLPQPRSDLLLPWDAVDSIYLWAGDRKARFTLHPGAQLTKIYRDGRPDGVVTKGIIDVPLLHLRSDAESFLRDIDYLSQPQDPPPTT